MSKRIFVTILTVCLVVLIAASSLLIISLYNRYNDVFSDSIETEAKFLAESVRVSGYEIYEDVDVEHRITISDLEGNVLFDNRHEPKSLGNHLDREEFYEALEMGYGYSVRQSSTLSEITINSAILIEDTYILRVSAAQPSIFNMLKEAAAPIMIILLFMVALSFVLASKAAEALVSPINRINLENPEESHIYHELDPFVKRISEQNKQIKAHVEAIKTEHEKQDAMRSEFTANVSHELMTPLTSISGYAELLKSGLVKDEDVCRFAGKIYDESQRLIVLVGDIIKLSKLDSQELKVTREDVDLYEISKEVISRLDKVSSDKKVTVAVTGERIKIFSVRQIIEEIVFNLCDNAIKYNKIGGTVNIAIKQYADGVELKVSDTGIGIPQEDLDRIFERFYRVDKSHSKEIGGTGLGLSIVKHGAKFLDARVSVSSEVDKGTEISILF